MSQLVHFQGNPVAVAGSIPQSGSKAQPFTLVAKDLSDVTLSQFAGKRKVLNIFPSIDTGVCAASVRKFNQLATEMDNTVVLCISADLPFAQSRFCGAEGLSNVITLSTPGKIRCCHFRRRAEGSGCSCGAGDRRKRQRCFQ